MPKVKREYYRRAKKMSDSTINIVQNICNIPSLKSTSSNSNISLYNISLYNNTNCVSNNFSLRQNSHSNCRLNNDLDLEQVNSNYNYSEENNDLENENSDFDFEQVNSNYINSEESNDVSENENINNSNFDINEVTNIINAPTNA